MRNGVRIGLLIAGAAIVGVPAVASAQDQPQGERHRDGGGEDRGGYRGGGQHPDAPAPAAAPTPRGPQANPAAGYAERRMRDADRHYQTPGQPAPAQPQAQPQGGQPDRGRGFSGGTPGGGRDYSRFGVNRTPEGNPGDDPRRSDGRQGFDNRPGNEGRQDYGNRPGNDGRQSYDNRPGNDGRRFDNRPGNDDRRFDNRPGYEARRFDGRTGNDGRRFAMQGWRNDRRYDWRGWRDTHRQAFRAPRYVAPRGYAFGYRPFSIGLRLDPFFYEQSYWIDDPWEYRLPPADGPYRWVRYYNDVLLVDIDTGEVVDVIRDFFW